MRPEPMPRATTVSRGGTILIIVSGICALMASLGLAFLTRMRSDGEESRLVLRDAQARIMLVAGCNYIQEASRLGWGTSGNPVECFGWVDVRDGFMGPKPTAYTAAQAASGDPRTQPSPNFPIGTVARYPMHVWKRTRYATQLTANHNPIQAEDAGAADFGMPYLRHPDPQPVAANGWPGAVGAAGFSGGPGSYLYGDPTPRANSLNLAWFRVRRVGPARFVITCGSGASRGLRDWDEARIEGEEAVFGDRQAFDELVAEEIRLWYLVEWNAAVGGATYQCVDNEQRPDHYQWRPFNPVHENYPSGHQSQTHARNFVGTIRWVQRLVQPPAEW